MGSLPFLKRESRKQERLSQVNLFFPNFCQELSLIILYKANSPIKTEVNLFNVKFTIHKITIRVNKPDFIRS